MHNWSVVQVIFDLDLLFPEVPLHNSQLQLEVLQPCLVVAKNLSQLLRIIPLLVAVRVAILGATGHEVIALRLDGTEIGETVILVLVDDVNLFSLIFRV